MKKNILLLISIILLIPTVAQAQYLRNSYFMESSSTRSLLNPALQPRRGYINIPVLGSFNAEVSSNSLGSQDIIDMFDEEDEFYQSQSFIDKLKADNLLNVNLRTDIISFGFHKGKGFWSFNLGTRIDVDAEIPKTMFEFLRESEDLENYTGGTGRKSYNINNENLRLNAYTEIGVGYSRIINERLSIGAKGKILLGWANLDLKVNKMQVDAYIPADAEYEYADAQADIKTDVELQLSGKGIEVSKDYENYIDDVEFNSFGIGGYGAALDLGVSYQLTNDIHLSASILDLGFLSWGKNNTISAYNNQSKHIDYLGDTDVLDFDLYGLKEKPESKGRTTKLSPTLVLAGEYSLLNNKLGLGLLSTTRFGQLNTYSELTAAATYRPNTFINATLSYSMLQGSDTFGLALKLGGFMIGTDYMFLGNNTKHVNAYIGMSIPLGKKKS